MKKIMLLFVVLVLLLPVMGCRSEESSIGILDMERVLEESKRANHLEEELSHFSESMENEEEQEENNDLEEVYAEYQENRQLVEGQLNEEVKEVLAELSEDYELKIILYEENIYAGGRDITDEVIENLDLFFYDGEDADE